MLNRIWVAFILVGFVAALAQLLQGDLDIFTRVLNGLFDTAKTGFDISLCLGAEASVSCCYYLLLPRRTPKSRVACDKMVTLCAFGPFVTSEAVSFIRTSAMSLGLL